jgi:membrane protease YdiL (CAAX protease family)
MNWALAAAAPVLVGLIFWATRIIHPAILAYHALCGIALWRRRARVRAFLRTDGSTLAWTAGTTLVIALCLGAAPFLHSPAPYRDLFRTTLLPWGDPATLFAAFAAYTMVVHAPLEEIFWRAVVMDPGTPAPRSTIFANAFAFYLLHAVPMSMVLGPVGLLAAVSAGAAGAVWAFVTIRSRSLWPGLVSHWGADGLILAGMWFYFIR